jgi:hypothetical protein
MKQSALSRHSIRPPRGRPSSLRFATCISARTRNELTGANKYFLEPQIHNLRLIDM